MVSAVGMILRWQRKGMTSLHWNPGICSYSRTHPLRKSTLVQTLDLYDKNLSWKVRTILLSFCKQSFTPFAVIRIKLDIDPARSRLHRLYKYRTWNIHKSTSWFRLRQIQLYKPYQRFIVEFQHECLKSSGGFSVIHQDNSCHHCICGP